jgi:hypothetical protein
MSELKLPTYKRQKAKVVFRRSVASAPTWACANAKTIPKSKQGPKALSECTQKRIRPVDAPRAT